MKNQQNIVAIAITNPPIVRIEITPVIVLVLRVRFLNLKIGIVKISTHKIGKHAKIPPKVDSLIVCPIYVVSNIVVFR